MDGSRGAFVAGLIIVTLSACSAPPASTRTLLADCPDTPLHNVSADELRTAVTDHAAWLASDNDPTGRKGKQATLRHANLRKANLDGVDLSHADLKGANLTGASLWKTRLRSANLTCAVLDHATLMSARLDFAKMQHASLGRTDLSDASLFEANLRGSSLWQTILVRADLDRADLEGAALDQTNLEGARVYRAKITDAIYRPANAPASGYIAGLAGVASVRLDVPDYSGLAQLRSAFKTAGLSESERQVTYAIERWRTNFLLRGQAPDPLQRAWQIVQGALRWALFEVTTDYGWHPERALWLVAGLWVVCAVVYLYPLSRPSLAIAGIFVTRPATRLMHTATGFAEAGTVDVRRLAPGSWGGRVGWACYYSLLSILSIGFRELNFQSWLSRLHRHDVLYHSVGWVRVLSGAQSLVGLYLIALFVLTYFGRPFE